MNRDRKLGSLAFLAFVQKAAIWSPKNGKEITLKVPRHKKPQFQLSVVVNQSLEWSFYKLIVSIDTVGLQIGLATSRQIMYEIVAIKPCTSI